MRILAGLALVLAVTLLAACGSSPAPPSAANPGGPAAAAFRYARCMRGHGVVGFPDPHVSVSPGHVSVSMMAPASAGSSPHFKSAQRACNGILPKPGAVADGQGPSAKVLLAFARCLRSHGESAFPDPNPQGRITRQMLSAAGINLQTPVFLSAAEACIGVAHGVITPADVHALVSGAH